MEQYKEPFNSWIAKNPVKTQIRNFYSEGRCYLNTKFYNLLFYLKFCPFLKMTSNNVSRYDTKNGQSTTLDFERAMLLYQVGRDIIDGKLKECSVIVPCKDCNLNLRRSINNMGKYETHLSINKNGTTIDFLFVNHEVEHIVNGVKEVKYIESGLGAFVKTLEGYLVSINAELHLNKYTDVYIKYNGQNSQNGGNNQNQGYQKNYNGYKKPYQKNNNWQPRNNQNQQPPQQQQGFSDYQLPN